MKVKDQFEVQSELFDVPPLPTRPHRSWWRSPRVWIIGLILLVIVVPSGYFLLSLKNSTSSGSSASPVNSSAPLDYIQSMAFSPDGRLLVAAVDHYDSDGVFTASSMMLWDVTSGKKLHTLSERGNVTSVAFSHDGRLVAIGFEDEDMLLWNVASGRPLSTIFVGSSAVNSLAFSPGGSLLATGTDDGKVRLWAVSSGQLLKTLPVSANSIGNTVVAFSPDGRFLAAGSDDIMVWDVATGQLLSPFPHTNQVVEVTSLAFSPGSDVLALSYETTANSSANAITLWDTTGQTKPRMLVSQDSLIYSISFSPDGRTLAAATDPGVIQQWDVASGKQRPDIQGTNEQLVAFDPQGHILASGGGNYSSNPNHDPYSNQGAYIELWNASTGNLLRLLN
jgi:WD40 repeat protein